MRNVIGIAAAVISLTATGCMSPVQVVEVPSYCEGICFDHDGYGYISYGKFIAKIDVAGDRIINPRWTEAGAPTGHKVLADGTHLICDGLRGRVARLAAGGEFIEDIAKECDGRRLRAPNDLTLDVKNHGFYFTDPGGSSIHKLIGTVHYVDSTGKCRQVAGGLAFPNGIVLTPDGTRLYVAESQKNRVLVAEVTGPGQIGELKTFCELPGALFGGHLDNQPDGMCLDADGNLYVAHYGMRSVRVINSKGEHVTSYGGGNLTTSNVAFGGPNHDQLFVTGAAEDEAKSPGRLYRLDLGVKGLEIRPEKRK